MALESLCTSMLSIFILFTWITYIGSSFSASFLPDDLAYIAKLHSLRYVVGTLALTEILFVYFLLFHIKVDLRFSPLSLTYSI